MRLVPVTVFLAAMMTAIPLAGAARAADEEPPAPPNPGLFGTSLLEGYSRKLGVGVAGSQGNINETTVTARMIIDKEDEAARRLFISRFYFSARDEVESAVEFFMEYGHDFLFSGSKFFVFARGRYDYDKVETWDHRVGGSGGVGYDIYGSDKWKVLGRLGAGVTHTFGGGPEPETRPEGQVGFDVKWNLGDNDSLLLTNNYFPDFKDLKIFRFVSILAWNVALDYMEGLGFTTGIENEYDRGRKDTPKNNLKYFLTLTYDF